MGRRERHRRDQRRRWRGSDSLAAGESWIRLVDPPPINGNGTPWVEFSYHDDGDSWQGIDMFVDSTGLPPNPRLQAGSLFTAERLGYARYTDGGAQEEIVFVSSDNGGAAPRTDGDHTIYVGQAASGRVDYEADGEWSSTDFLIGNGAPFAFNDVLLRWRCSPTASVPWELVCDGGETTTFHSFAAGDDHDDDGPGITIDSPLDGGTFSTTTRWPPTTPAMTPPASHRARATCLTGTTSTPPRWALTRSRSTPSTTSATRPRRPSATPWSTSPGLPSRS